MGLPAVDMLHRTRKREPRSRLRVVRGGASSSRKNVSRRGGEPFALFCVLLIGLALFGMARVMFAASATEASIRAGLLREDIKAEQLLGDQLEVDRSALTVPSRIENIAGTTMQMAEADNIAYMSLSTVSADLGSKDEAEEAAPITAAVMENEESGFSGLLSSVMAMAASEAHVMLVGDVGLASTD